jgi:hypothetical protein
VKFTRIETCSVSGADNFRYGEPLRFRISIKAEGMLPSLFIGAGVDDILGHRVATFDSNHVDFDFSIQQGRGYAFELSIPQPYLNPGRYFLSVSLFSGLTFYDLLVHATSFDIVPIHAETGEYFEPLQGSGALGVPYEWMPADVGVGAVSR